MLHAGRAPQDRENHGPPDDINYLVNEEPGTHGFKFVAAPGRACRRWRSASSGHIYERAAVARHRAGRYSLAEKTLDVPAIKVGGSLLYFVDRYGARVDTTDINSVIGRDRSSTGQGRALLPQSTSPRATVVAWMSEPGFTSGCSTSRQILFDIRSVARPVLALTSPDGKIRIQITRMRRFGQIEEYLHIYRGQASSISPAARAISADGRDTAQGQPAVHAVAAGYLFRRSIRGCRTTAKLRGCTAMAS